MPKDTEFTEMRESIEKAMLDIKSKGTRVKCAKAKTLVDSFLASARDGYGMALTRARTKK